VREVGCFIPGCRPPEAQSNYVDVDDRGLI
jgi:hypothetical protein